MNGTILSMRCCTAFLICILARQQRLERGDAEDDDTFEEQVAAADKGGATSKRHAALARARQIRGRLPDEMYGDAKITLKTANLTQRRGANFTGALEHWHYDVFRVTWHDRQGQTVHHFQAEPAGPDRRR